MQSLHLFASLALLSAYNFSCVPDAFALVRLRRSPRPHSCSKVSKRFLVVAGYVQESILGHLHRVSTVGVTAKSCQLHVANTVPMQHLYHANAFVRHQCTNVQQNAEPALLTNFHPKNVAHGQSDIEGTEWQEHQLG